jgi:hypothetical protein
MIFFNFINANILERTILKYFIIGFTYYNWSRGSSVSIVSDYRLDVWATAVRSLRDARVFPLAPVFRPALRPSEPPFQ